MKIAVFALALALPAIASAQDPVKTLPDSYSLQFENEWVKVVRVRYAPHAKLPAHTHTALPAAYVYLNDGGPVLFRHIDTPYGPAVRPATRAGGFRVYRGLKEVHEVENTSELPSEFLRIEFKTDPKDPSSLTGRYFRDPKFTEGERVQFENEQIRISRLLHAPGRAVRGDASNGFPALVIALTPAQFRSANGSVVNLKPGQERWLPAVATDGFENAGGETIELLRFDFKTPPIAAETQPDDESGELE